MKGGEIIIMDEFTKMDENTPQTIKVGEKEYSQDELSKLVGLGEMGRDAEEKYGVTLDKVWPNHQKTINEKLALEKELNDLRSKPPVVQTQEQLSEAQIKEQTRAYLNEMGYVSKQESEQIAFNMVQGFQLRNSTQSMIETQTEAGYPETTIDDVLKHMSETGINDPKRAYKDMFEDQIDKIKEEKLKSLKPSQFVTTTTSTAGSKAPAPQMITSKNLRDAIAAALPD